MIKPFEFYFDFASPYSFIAHKKIRKIEKENFIKINNPTSFLMEATQQSIKDELKRRTDNAYKKGIFGAPSFNINNKIFWGQDRLEFVLSAASK